MAEVLLYVEDPTTALLTYTTIRLYRDTSPNGAFSSVLTTTALVAGQSYYSITDASGTSDHFYRWTLYNSTGPVETDQSPVIQSFGNTLRRMRYEGAMGASAAFRSTADAGGTTTALVDPVLADSAVDTFFAKGAWIYRPDAALAADMCRRVASYDTATFTLAVARAWTNAPADDEEYEVYMLMPPIDQPGASWSWDRAVREGLRSTWFVDTLNLGLGTSAGLRRFDLSSHSAYVHYGSVRRVFLRTTDDNGVITDDTLDPWLWSWVENGVGSIAIDLGITPTTSESVMVQVNRVDADLYIDTDVTLAPFERACNAIRALAYERLNAFSAGKYAAEEEQAMTAWLAAEHREGPRPVVLGV